VAFHLAFAGMGSREAVRSGFGELAKLVGNRESEKVPTTDPYRIALG
jgi:hypothetical protein